MFLTTTSVCFRVELSSGDLRMQHWQIHGRCIVFDRCRTSEVAKEALECFKDAGAPPHDAVARRPATQEVVVLNKRRPT